MSQPTPRPVEKKRNQSEPNQNNFEQKENETKPNEMPLHWFVLRLVEEVENHRNDSTVNER
jgi:hypothetical protein